VRTEKGPAEVGEREREWPASCDRSETSKKSSFRRLGLRGGGD